MNTEQARQIIEQGMSHPDYAWAVRVNATSYRNLGRKDGVDPDRKNRNSTGGGCFWFLAVAASVAVAAAIVVGVAALAIWLATK